MGKTKAKRPLAERLKEAFASTQQACDKRVLVPTGEVATMTFKRIEARGIRWDHTGRCETMHRVGNKPEKWTRRPDMDAIL